MNWNMYIHLQGPLSYLICLCVSHSATFNAQRFEYSVPSYPQTGTYSSVQILEHWHLVLPFSTWHLDPNLHERSAHGSIIESFFLVYLLKKTVGQSVFAYFEFLTVLPVKHAVNQFPQWFHLICINKRFEIRTSSKFFQLGSMFFHGKLTVLSPRWKKVLITR